ncbi:MAG: hypothetical protein KGN02_05145 [bacterium]|nr:hypothetical protein [bacterium]
MKFARSTVRALGVAFLAFAAACAHHNGPAPRALTLPYGIVTHAPLVEGRSYGGLYPGHVGDSGVWTGERAAFDLRKTHRATRLAIVFYVPGGKDALGRWFGAHPISLSLRVAGSKPQTICCFHGGIGSAHVELPPALRELRGDVPIALVVHGAVVPHAIDPSQGDTRRLGIILLRTFFY